jgi:hypothetical protein
MIGTGLRVTGCGLRTPPSSSSVSETKLNRPPKAGDLVNLYPRNLQPATCNQELP